MSFPTRISQQDLSISNRTNNQNSYFSVTPVLTPSMIRSANSGLKSIHQQSAINMAHAEVMHEGELEHSIEPVLHHPGLKHHRLHLQNRARNYNSQNEQQKSKINRPRMRTQNPQILNSFKDLNQKSYETINQINGYPLSESTYEQGEDLPQLRPKYKNKHHIIKPLSQKVYLHKNGLQQVVEQLQIHNRQMMKQTKQTVQDYQMYISQLLQQNLKMQQHLSQYQNYLQQIQNEKLNTLQQQKQRQKLLQKTIKQKISLQKSIQTYKQIQSLSPPTLTQNKIYNQNIQSNYKNKQQINQKQQHIQMLEKLIQQKQNVIKKMATFNNEMCLQLMQYKNKRNQTILSSRNDTETSSRKQRETSNRSNTPQKNKIKQLENKIKKLTKQKQQLKQDNINLQEQLGNIIIQNQSISNVVSQQNTQIKYLQSQLQTISQGQSNKFNHQPTSIHENKQTKYKNDLHSNYQSADTQSQVLSLTRKRDYIKPQNEQNIQWDQDLDNGVILQKIDYLLKCLYDRLKDNGKKKQYKQTIHSIMRTLTEINDEATDAELSRTESAKVSPKNSNILSYFDDQNQKGSSIILERNNINLKPSKNEKIFDKVKKMKKKMKSQASSQGDSEEGSNNSNDDYEDDTDIGVFNGIKQERTEQFELTKNGGRNRIQFAQQNNIFKHQN